MINPACEHTHKRGDNTLLLLHFLGWTDAAPTMPQYHAQFPYKALGDGELTLAEGERVQVIAQQGTFCLLTSCPVRLTIFPVEGRSCEDSPQEQ